MNGSVLCEEALNRAVLCEKAVNEAVLCKKAVNGAVLCEDAVNGAVLRAIWSETRDVLKNFFCCLLLRDLRSKIHQWELKYFSWCSLNQAMKNYSFL